MRNNIKRKKAKVNIEKEEKEREKRRRLPEKMLKVIDGVIDNPRKPIYLSPEYQRVKLKKVIDDLVKHLDLSPLNS